MPLDFTAIDFETAAPSRASVCAVAVTRVRAGQVVDERSTLVCPPTGLDGFSNSWVHGITAAQVVDAPAWGQVLPWLVDFIGADPVVAHNAAFDQSVFRQASEASGYRVVLDDFFCTLRMAKSLLDLPKYSLPLVSAALGLPRFAHHDAAADARAAALVAVGLAARCGAEDVVELSRMTSRTTVRREALSPRGAESAASWAARAIPGALTGHVVCFTGPLDSMERPTAQDLVRRLGGVVTQGPTRKSTLVVSGGLDPRQLRAGAMSGKLTKAFALVGKGIPVQIIAEEQFLAMIGLGATPPVSATSRIG